MSDLNKWIGSGRVTRDTELRFTPAGTAVADVGLASNRVWFKDGDKREETVFVDITVWGKQAESLAPYLTKGAFIMVEARLELDTWESPEGDKRSKLKLVSDRINLGPKSGGGSKPEANSKPSVAKAAAKAKAESEQEVPF